MKLPEMKRFHFSVNPAPLLTLFLTSMLLVSEYNEKDISVHIDCRRKCTYEDKYDQRGNVT